MTGRGTEERDSEHEKRAGGIGHTDIPSCKMEDIGPNAVASGAAMGSLEDTVSSAAAGGDAHGGAGREKGKRREEEGAEDTGRGSSTRPAPSSWMLGEDACARFKELQAEGMEQAGRWLFQEARKGGELIDMFEFSLDSGARVRGHRSWLMARCMYIRKMLSNGMRESKTGVVPVRECGEGALIALLEFLYTGRLGDACQGQDWGEVWELADLFLVEGMKSMLLDAVTLVNVEEAAQVAVERGMRGLMERCVAVLPSKPANSNEARRVMRTVDILSKGEDADECRELAGSGITAVIGAMLSHSGDAFVQERGCIAISNVASMGPAAENCFKATTSDGIGAVVEALKIHSTNSLVQQNGCKALSELCNNHARNQDRAVDAGGFEAIVGALKNHSDDTHVQANACEALFFCLSDVCGRYNRAGLDRAGAAGGVEAVVEALKNHGDNIQVQAMGCKALFQLWRYHEANQNRGGAAGGVEVVVEALRSHSDEIQVQANALEALAQLCYRQYDNHVTNRYRAGTAGGVEAVVEALRSHSDEVQAREFAFRTLALLCRDMVANQDRAGAAGGVEVVVEALKNHGDDISIKKMACGPLSCLCRDHVANQDRAGAAGGVEAVVEMIKCYSIDTSRCHERAYAFEVLSYLSCNNLANQDRAGVAGGVEAVVQALKTHGNDILVQRQACAALYELCRENDQTKQNHVANQDRAGAAGGVEALGKVLEGKHRNSPAIKENACKALSCLCCGHVANQDRALGLSPYCKRMMLAGKSESDG